MVTIRCKLETILYAITYEINNIFLLLTMYLIHLCICSYAFMLNLKYNGNINEEIKS